MAGDLNINDGSILPIVEEFYSIQGEGCNTGRAAYFVRIGGCDIGCSWCDTKYAWNADLHPMVAIEGIIDNVLKSGADSVVVTGGEPLMWNLTLLCSSLAHSRNKNFHRNFRCISSHRQLGLDYPFTQKGNAPGT